MTCEQRRALLPVVGAYMVAAARRNIAEQVLADGRQMPPRYFGSEPYMNVAGAIEDLQTSPRIKARRYDKRPALRDTGDMLNRIGFVVHGDELAIGADVPYAKRLQQGGESRQVLDATVAGNLNVALRQARKRKDEVTLSRLGPVAGAIRRGDAVWTTTVIPRPFVGLTQRDARDLAEAMEAHIRADRR